LFILCISFTNGEYMLICKNCNHELREKHKHELNDHPEIKYYHKHGKKYCFCLEGFIPKNPIHIYCGCGKPEEVIQ